MIKKQVALSVREVRRAFSAGDAQEVYRGRQGDGVPDFGQRIAHGADLFLNPWKWQLTKREKVALGAGTAAAAAVAAFPINTINVLALGGNRTPLAVFRQLRGDRFPFFKGADFFGATVAVQQTAKFFLFEQNKTWLKGHFPHMPENSRVLLAGFFAGIGDAVALVGTEAILHCERRLLSQKVETLPEFFFQGGKQVNPINLFTVSRYMKSTFGWSSFVTGLGGLAGRNGPFTFCWLGGSALWGSAVMNESDSWEMRAAKQVPGVVIGTVFGTPASYFGHRMMVWQQAYLFTNGKPAPRFGGIKFLASEFKTGGMRQLFSNFSTYAANFAFRFPVGLAAFYAGKEFVEHRRRQSIGVSD